MKVLLCGYNWAGCNALQSLLDNNHEVFVCTHESPYYIPSLYEYAREQGVGATYESVNSCKLPFVPDVLCSVYYRHIISGDILKLVNYRAMNLHPSLLPAYRGCSSLTWAMINNEKEVGFTYHYIDEGCDTGAVILQRSMAIYPFDNQQNLYQRVMFESMNYFLAALEALSDGVAGVQQNGPSSYYPRGAPFDGKINGEWDKNSIKRFIRAFINPPLPVASYEGVYIHDYEQFRAKRLEDSD